MSGIPTATTGTSTRIVSSLFTWSMLTWVRERLIVSRSIDFTIALMGVFVPSTSTWIIPAPWALARALLRPLTAAWIKTVLPPLRTKAIGTCPA